MSAKTTKPAAKKAAPKKTTKRKPTQLDRIDKRVMALDRQVRQALGILGSYQRAIQADIQKVESSLAVLRSGSTFEMRSISDRLGAMRFEQYALAGAKEDATKGLRPGDYCDASKEVADALTAMGWGWLDADRSKWDFIVWDDHAGGMLNTTCVDDTHLDRETFLSRAAVTAKELGLQPVVEWVPKCGDLIFGNHPSVIPQVYECDGANPKTRILGIKGNGKVHPIDRFRPATKEEVTAYNAAKQEQDRKEKERKEKERKEKEARLVFGCSVKVGSGPMVYWYTLLNGLHKVVGQGGTFLEVSTDELTIIDP
jgi:predicted  nucleic acid-binding Zn-ribbon protein